IVVSPRKERTMATSSLFSRLRSRLRRDADDDRLASTVSAHRAVELVRSGAALLDVRERHEWRTGHAPQAIHVPLGTLDPAPPQLSPGQPVLVVCASGMRSRTAAKHLRSLGVQAASVSGGMGQW